jgi:outer membrane cobalamin receptor
MRKMGIATITIMVSTCLLVWTCCSSSQTADSLNADTGRDIPDSAAAVTTGRPTATDSSGVTAGCRPARGAALAARTAADRERMLRLASLSPGEALVLDPGADIAVYGSLGLPQLLSLRSAGPGDVVFLLDGTPVSDRHLGLFDLNWLPLQGMSRIELSKGAGSSFYGNGALGGVVNLVPAGAMTDVPLSCVDAWWGSFGSRFLGLSLRRSVAGHFGVLGAYENARSGGWIDDSGYDGEKFYGKLTGAVGGGRAVEAVVYRYRGEADLPDSCPLSIQTSAGELDDRRDMLKVSVYPRGGSPLCLTYYRLSVSHKRTDLGRQEYSEGRLDRLEATAAFGGASGTSVVGLGLVRRKVLGSPVGRQNSNDIHAFARGDLDGTVRALSWALGVEKNSDFGTEIAASLLGRLYPGAGHLLFARLDRSYGFPSFAETARDTLLEDGDPEPDTHHAVELELGYRYEARRLAFDVSCYWRDMNRMTVWVTDEACGAAMSTDSESEVLGFEVSLGFSHPLGVEGVVAYGSTTTLEEVQGNLEFQPPHIITWDLWLERGVSPHVSVGTGFAGRWVSSRSAGNRVSPCTGAGECVIDAALAGYTSALCYAYLAIDRARIYTRIRNLLDDDIYSRWGQPALPARSYEIGVSWELSD